MNDPYKVLGVSPDATDEQVKKAYLALARKYHPDKYTDSDLADLAAEKMKEVNAAYDAIQQMRAGGGAHQNGYGGSRQGGHEYSGAGAQGQNGDFAAIRRLINLGDVNGAYRMLQNVDFDQRGAEWCFLMGCVEVRYRRYADAARHFDEACQRDPANEEYHRARSNLHQHASEYGGGYRTTNREVGCCDVCGTLLCADCCCECMGGDLIPGC